MSNQAVGNVYQAIIEEVINSSRVDFEESGVEEAVLEELRQGWQRKLTQLDVARFPWDPTPPPANQAAPASAVAQPVQTPAAYASPQLNPPQGLSLPAVTPQGNQPNGLNADAYVKTEAAVPIKQEPGAAQPFPAHNNMDNKGNIAMNRAAQQLHAQYGPRAAGSINALHQGQQPQTQAQPVQGQAQTQPQLPQQPQATQQQQQFYRQQMAAQQQQQQRAANGQTDGAGDEDEDEDDFEAVLVERGAHGNMEELGRVEIDRMLHEKLLANAKSMEGGGLMLPLKEVSRHTAGSTRSKAQGKQPAAYDGGDDEEDDEDAINSDLDDPDEDRDEDEVDDEGLGHIMLCMYDKVQRVKNKWKCTLKDGVLTVNGKEYVFHKATGEYEW